MVAVSNLEKLKVLAQKIMTREEQMSEILNNIPDIVICGRGNGLIGQINMACVDILGWQPQDMAGRKWQEFVHPDDVESTAEVVELAKNNEKTEYNFINRYRTKDNRYVWLSWNIKPRSKDGLVYSTARRVEHAE